MLNAAILPENFELTSVEGMPILVLIVAFLLAIIVVRILKKALYLAVVIVVTGFIAAWITGGAVGWDFPVNFQDLIQKE